jgi:hypothetical protein
VASKLGLRDSFIAAQKFVSLDVRHDAFMLVLLYVILVPLNASETPHAHRARECDLMRKCENDLHG